MKLNVDFLNHGNLFVGNREYMLENIIEWIIISFQGQTYIIPVTNLCLAWMMMSKKVRLHLEVFIFPKV